MAEGSLAGRHHISADGSARRESSSPAAPTLARCLGECEATSALHHSSSGCGTLLEWSHPSCTPMPTIMTHPRVSVFAGPFCQRNSRQRCCRNLPHLQPYCATQDPCAHDTI